MQGVTWVVLHKGLRYSCRGMLCEAGPAIQAGAGPRVHSAGVAWPGSSPLYWPGLRATHIILGHSQGVRYHIVVSTKEDAQTSSILSDL